LEEYKLDGPIVQIDNSDLNQKKREYAEKLVLVEAEGKELVILLHISYIMAVSMA
jgi:hypothetical protein